MGRQRHQRPGRREAAAGLWGEKAYQRQAVGKVIQSKLNRLPVSRLYHCLGVRSCNETSIASVIAECQSTKSPNLSSTNRISLPVNPRDKRSLATFCKSSTFME